jgi:hypothetical protein
MEEHQPPELGGEIRTFSGEPVFFVCQLRNNEGQRFILGSFFFLTKDSINDKNSG